MDENRMYAFCWSGAFLTLIAAIFMISSCVQEQSKIDAKVQLECAKMGGDWVPAAGSSEKYTCTVRR